MCPYIHTHVLWITVRWEVAENVNYKGASCTAVSVVSFLGTAEEVKLPVNCAGGQPTERSHTRTAGGTLGNVQSQMKNNSSNITIFANKEHTFNDARTTWFWGRKKGVYYMIWHWRQCFLSRSKECVCAYSVEIYDLYMQQALPNLSQWIRILFMSTLSCRKSLVLLWIMFYSLFCHCSPELCVSHYLE